MPDTFSILRSIENTDEFHLSRLLLLIHAFSGASGLEPVEGLTKLAKLDFFLRYPLYLERALEIRHVNPQAVRTAPYERTNVESTMVRYRFGPWDYRYRRFLNLLAARGLASVSVSGRTILIAITAKGNEIASQLLSLEEFEVQYDRAKLLKRHLDLTATNLMHFVYKHFPEVATLRSRSEIAH
jgi:hypothetical protein